MYEVSRLTDASVKKTTVDEVRDTILLKDMGLRTEILRTNKSGGP